MTAPRFEIAHTGPYQFHARFVAANGEIVWWTETYRTRSAATQAIMLLTSEARRMAPDPTRWLPYPVVSEPALT